jgi:hypothetical protein
VSVAYAAARFANTSVEGSVFAVNCCVLKCLRYTA